MNINSLRQQERIERIQMIISTINKSILSQNFINVDNLFSEASLKWGCSWRTFDEYLKCALVETSTKIILQDKQKIIVPQEPAF